MRSMISLFRKAPRMGKHRRQVGVGMSLTDSGVRGVILHKNKNNRIVIDDASEHQLSFSPQYHHAINTSKEVGRGLKRVQHQLKISRAHCGIPSRHYFYRCLTVPKADAFDEMSLQAYLQTWLHDHVQLPNTELVCEYEVVEDTIDHWQVAVAVVPQSVLSRYRELFLSAGVHPVSLGTHIDMLHRTCLVDAHNTTDLIVELEPRSAHFVVFKNRRPLWNHTVYGGEAGD